MKKTGEFLALLFLFIEVYSSYVCAANSAREVEVAWRALPGAVKYDLQIANNSQLDPLLLRKSFQATKTKLMLVPGTYYFRVRGIDRRNTPGPWSEVQGFVVNPHPPQLRSPQQKAAFGAPLDESGVAMAWEEGVEGSRYFIEIRDKNGTILERSVDRPVFHWMPPRPGVYRWRVGYETVTGAKEWGDPRFFLIRASALPSSKPQVRTIIKKETPWVAPIDRETPAGLALVLRAAQSVVAYNVDDPDRHIKNSAAALVGAASVELRWRLRRVRGQPWLISGSVSMEALRQIILDSTFVLPRAYLRVFATRYGKSRWRYGPFLHLGKGQGGIFIVDDRFAAVKTRVSRTTMGLGAMAQYEVSDALDFNFFMLLRRDSGGEAVELPNPVDTNLGFEAGFGSAFNLSENWSLEARLRVQKEAFSWKAALGGDQSGSVSNTYVILDLGIGYQF